MRKKASVILVAAILVVGTVAYASTQVSTESTTLKIGDASLTSTKTTVETSNKAEVRQEPVSSIVTIQDVSGDKDYDLVVTLSKYGVSVSVEELRTTIREYRLGNGEIVLAYNLAHSSGRPVTEIVKMRCDQKMGWGVIAKTLGVRLKGETERTTVILREAKLDKDDVEFRTVIKFDLEDDDQFKEVKKNKDDRNDKEDHHNNSHGNGNGKGHGKKN